MSVSHKRVALKQPMTTSSRFQTRLALERPNPFASAKYIRSVLLTKFREKKNVNIHPIERESLIAIGDILMVNLGGPYNASVLMTFRSEVPAGADFLVELALFQCYRITGSTHDRHNGGQHYTVKTTLLNEIYRLAEEANNVRKK